MQNNDKKNGTKKAVKKINNNYKSEYKLTIIVASINAIDVERMAFTSAC